MGGRSSSFRSRKNSGGAMPSVPTLHGSKDQIAQAEKIRKHYADALKNLDEDMKDQPTCLKVEKTTVLNNMIKLLNHLKGLKR